MLTSRIGAWVLLLATGSAATHARDLKSGNIAPSADGQTVTGIFKGNFTALDEPRPGAPPRARRQPTTAGPSTMPPELMKTLGAGAKSDEAASSPTPPARAPIELATCRPELALPRGDTRSPDEAARSLGGWHAVRQSYGGAHADPGIRRTLDTAVDYSGASGAPLLIAMAERLALQASEADAPEFKIEGEGLAAVVKVGHRAVRLDGERLRLE